MENFDQLNFDLNIIDSKESNKTIKIDLEM